MVTLRKYARSDVSVSERFRWLLFFTVGVFPESHICTGKRVLRLQKFVCRFSSETGNNVLKRVPKLPSVDVGIFPKQRRNNLLWFVDDLREYADRRIYGTDWWSVRIDLRPVVTLCDVQD